MVWTAAWFLDTDYDGATFLVRQAYFPTQTPNPWEKISRALKGSVDPELFAVLQRTTERWAYQVCRDVDALHTLIDAAVAMGMG